MANKLVGPFCIHVKPPKSTMQFRDEEILCNVDLDKINKEKKIKKIVNVSEMAQL